MRRLLTILCLVAATHLSALPVRSYTLHTTEGQTSAPLRWANRRITVTLSSSLFTPPSNIKPGSDVIGAVRMALAHWSAVSNIRFTLAFSKAESVSPANTGGDGMSLITVAHTPENAALFGGPSGDSSGRTRLFYTEAGNITEADIALNPSQQFSTDGTVGTYDLEATLTHELGHLLGLEHSGVAGATMQPRQGKNGLYGLPAIAPRTLSDDDRAGVRALYGVRGENEKELAAMAGRISYAGGAPVYGGHVWVEDVDTGKVSASGLTLANGSYRIEGLVPGSYRVWVESLDGAVAAAEIANGRGSYAGLAINQLPPFRTQEVGSVRLLAGETVRLNAQLSGLPVLLNPAFIGLNEQLSTIAIPLVAGRTYTVYIGGEGVNINQLSPGSITVASPFISVNASSLARQDFGSGPSVLSFELTVDPNAPTGEYSLRLTSSTGEVAFLVGALAVEGVEPAAGELGQLSIAPFDAPGTSDLALFAGSLVTLSGGGLQSDDARSAGVESVVSDSSVGPGHEAAAVNLTYASGATSYIPLATVGPERLGFRIPERAETGRVLVEVYLNGRKSMTMPVEVIGTDVLSKMGVTGLMWANESRRRAYNLGAED